MRKPLIVVLALALAVGGCGRVRESRLNPFNWFGGAPAQTERVAAEQGTPAATDKRQLVAQVTELKFDPYAGGVIVRATGVPPTQGWWEAALVPRPVDDKGVLVFDFRVFPPGNPTSSNTPRSREIVAAASLNDYKLAQVKRVVVQGASNALGANR